MNAAFRFIFFAMLTLSIPGIADTAEGPGIFTGSDMEHAISNSQKIQNCRSGGTRNCPEALLEILEVLNRAKTHGGTKMNVVITSAFKMAVDFARAIPNFESSPFRDQIYQECKSLLSRIQQGAKQAYIIQLFDALWLWSPDQLEFFAHMIRNDRINPISAQVMYALAVASDDRRQAFFAATIPWTRINPKIRWFILALAHQYGEGDQLQLISALRAVDPNKIRPVVQSFPFDRIIPNSLDLYMGIMERLNLYAPCVQNLTDTATTSEL